jgi:hypothetical protein
MEGYHKIARLMGQHSDLAIVRRFSELNIKDLLYAQAELVHLESELHSIAEEDQKHHDRAWYARDWWSLAQPQDEDESQAEQWEKVLEIREKLKAYSACVKLQTSPTISLM